MSGPYTVLLLAIELHVRNGADAREGHELRLSVQETLEYLGVLPK